MTHRDVTRCPPFPALPTLFSLPFLSQSFLWKTQKDEKSYESHDKNEKKKRFSIGASTNKLFSKIDDERGKEIPNADVLEELMELLLVKEECLETLMGKLKNKPRQMT